MTQLNIDNQEIHTFDENATDWWNAAGSFKTLHDLNPMRLGFIDAISDLANKKVLDVGCGGGILAEAMAKQGAEVTGIDASEKALAIARAHALEENISLHYEYATAEIKAEENPGYFDVVTCMELLEHVPDFASVVQACSQLVKENGDVFFSTINRNLRAYFLAIVAAEYLLKMIPKGVHQYGKFIRPSELAAAARAAGLAVIKIQGVTYHPLTRSFQLTADTRVNYMMHCKKL
jgi:2-polyprenyl-6-hydroxyphenyl methylase / 3-demethylubiquinone-9 3-methyltransferase